MAGGPQAAAGAAAGTAAGHAGGWPLGAWRRGGSPGGPRGAPPWARWWLVAVPALVCSWLLAYWLPDEAAEGCRGGRVIIIGAGLAGLAAAQTLRRAGCAPAVVLEAADEAGGRTRSFRDGPFEGFARGALWVHGGESNIVLTSLLRFFNLTMVWVGGDEAFEGDPARIRPRHRGALAVDLQERAAQLFRDFEDEALAIARQIVTPEQGNKIVVSSDCSMADVLAAYQNITDLNATDRWLLDWQASLSNEQRIGAPMQSLGYRLVSRATYVDFKEPPEWQRAENEAHRAGGASGSTASPRAPPAEARPRRGDAVVRGGYSRLVERLAEGIDVRLGAPVRSVKHSPGGVVVHTDTDSFSGRAVLYTASIGVLRAGDIEFSPWLSLDKHFALGRLRMGEVAKIFIRFRPGRSPVDESSYLTLRLPDVPSGQRLLLYYCICDCADEPGRCRDILECHAGGQAAREAEQVGRLGPAAVRDAVARELKALFPAFEADALEAVHVEPWTSSTPLHGGAWGHGAVGTTSSDFEVLAQPLGRLYFAGEGTCRLMYGTTHGALVSGARAAWALGARPPGGRAAAAAWPLFGAELRGLCDALPAHEVAAVEGDGAARTCGQLWWPLARAVPSVVRSWRAMGGAARRDWQNLGWSAIAWGRDGARLPRPMTVPWRSLPPREQRAAQRLGFTAPAWDTSLGEHPSISTCRRRPRHFRWPWDKLTLHSRWLWIQLGLRRTIWDEDIAWAFNLSFWDLLDGQRIAALKLGFRAGWW